jgi:hypothetical protein
MAITVTHKFVSAIPDAGDPTIVQPSNWNDTHQLAGLGTMAEQDANNVAITGGTITGVSVSGYVPTTRTLTAGTGLTGGGDLSANRTFAIANTGVTAGTYGSDSRSITQIVNAQGQITSIYDQPIAIAYTAVSGLGTAATKDAGVANGVATLDGSGTVPISQLPAAVLGALSYQGTWNASTNTPTLTSSVGTKGYYYVVSVAGTTNLNGITDWQIGDWAVFNGSTWQKIDNTDAVTSVNGYTGTVVLNAADVGAVPYTGATGAVDLNAKSLTNVSNLGINTTSVPTIKIRAVGDNNSGSRIAMRGYSSDANSSSIRVTKFRGTVAAPQAPQSGDSLGKFELAGYGTTSSDGYPQASYEGLATEAWGATARGAKVVFKVTPNTTTTQVIALTIDQNSAATFASTVTANGVLLTGNTGTVTSVAATAGTGISVSGSPITTSGTLTITNTAPDQTVAIASGTGISVTGTYPNFTVTNTSPSLGGTVTSVAQSFTGGLISVAGSPITSSGTLALTVAGTSGGIPYFSSATTWATSAALAASALVIGGGAGVAPSTITTGTGVVTALGVNTGSSGAFVVNGGALGTPSSGTVTNLTGTASININGTVGATTATTGAFTTVSASGVITSTIATGTAPFTVTSTTAVTNLSIGGNAGTVTNGVYTTGSYADPTWITSLAGSKITGTIDGGTF